MVDKVDNIQRWVASQEEKLSVGGGSVGGAPLEFVFFFFLTFYFLSLQYIFSVCGCVCVCVCTRMYVRVYVGVYVGVFVHCTHYAHRVQGRVLDSLELELQVAVSCQV